MATVLWLLIFTAGVWLSTANATSDDGVQCHNNSETYNRSTTQCIPLTDVLASNQLHTNCTRFIASDRCYIYTSNTTDFNYISHTMDTIVEAIQQVENERVKNDKCGDILLGVVCNAFYVGCNPVINIPITLCRNTCLEYSNEPSCLPFIDSVFKVLNEREEENVDINLGGYLNCSISNSFHRTDYNESRNITHSCYEELTGISVSDTLGEEMTTDLEGIAFEDNNDDNMGNGGEETNVRELILTYVLPSVSGVCGGVVLCGVLVFAGCYLRKLRKRSRRIGATAQRNSHSNTEAFPQLASKTEVMLYSNHYTLPYINEGDDHIRKLLLPLPTSGNTSLTTSSGAASNVTENLAVFQLELSDWEAVGEGVLIPFEHVTITGYLGEGAFGYVVKGLLKDVLTNGQEYHIPVAMKTLKNCASYDEMRDLLVECSLMHSFSHSHILSLRGLCLDPHSGAPYLVMPYMENGDLRTFLRKKADLAEDTDTFPQGLDHELLAQMCCDVAKGMEYLAEKRLVHRDLAARNCMVDRSLRVKVADFGLTREIYEQDCYRQSSHGQLPVKWMSPESLAYRMSNEKTDVWSFGVTCWEVFSLGKVPYPTIDNRDLLDYLENGCRPSKPRLCHQHMYDVMILCWNMEPTERPTFSQLVTLIESSTHTPSTHSTSVQPVTIKSKIWNEKEKSPDDSKTKGLSFATQCLNDEYVDMSFNGDERDEMMIVANSSIVSPSSSVFEPTPSPPRYFNVTILDSSGTPIETNTSLPLQAALPSNALDHHDDEAVILTNASVSMSVESLNHSDGETVAKRVSYLETEPRNASTAAVRVKSMQNEERMTINSGNNPQSVRRASAAVTRVDLLQKNEKMAVNSASRSLTLTRASKSAQLLGNYEKIDAKKYKTLPRASESDATLDKGLLFSITDHFRQKTKFSEESCARDDDSEFIAIQMRELENSYKSTDDLTVTSSLHHSHTHPSRQSNTQVSMLKPCVEGTAMGSLESPIRIYDECPTTPHVTISFKSGEKVTPVDTIFAFSPYHKTKRRSEDHGIETVVRNADQMGDENDKRCSVASLPGGRDLVRGGWRDRMRERFFSYSVGDYIKMNPAPSKP